MVSSILWKVGFDYRRERAKVLYPKKYVNEFSWQEASVRELGMDNLSRKLFNWPPVLVEKPLNIDKSEVQEHSQMPSSLSLHMSPNAFESSSSSKSSNNMARKMSNSGSFRRKSV